ncbi:hypothetical protein Tco_0069821 [Tanacetum coccineum]
MLQQQDIAIWLALQMKFEKIQVPQEQDDEFDFWTDSYASDDDEILTKQVTQDIMEEISLTIDEAKLKKMADEMLRQRCILGDEHQKEKKIVLSVHKFPSIVFNDDDIEERTSRWVNKCIKKFNPYARYGLYQCSSRIHKFCDATLRRTLEGLKSYYNDVKYGYVQKELTNDEVEFLKLFEEEIEVRLKFD